MLVFVYDAEHSRQSQIRYQLGCALDWLSIKRKVAEDFVVCFAAMQSPGVRELIPPGSWMEESLMFVFRPDGSLQWRTHLQANPTTMSTMLDAVLAGNECIELPAGATAAG